MEPAMFACLVVIGVISGVFIGSIGMGGGAVMTPLLLLTGVPLKGAVAIGLAIQLVPQSLFGVIEFWRSGHLNVSHATAVALGSAAGIYGGAILLNRDILPEKWIYRMLSAFMIAGGIYMSRLGVAA